MMSRALKNSCRITAGLAVLLGTLSVQAADPPNFDFLGYVPSVPSSNGQTLRLFSVVNNNSVVPTPIPLDFTSQEHTLVIEATLNGRSGFSQFYGPATVRIYSDAGPATAHDFAKTSTFTDGQLILSGAFDGTLTRDQYTTSLGSFVGHVRWTGGSRLGELGGNTSGWTFGGGISRTIAGIPSGFVESWDGKIDQRIVAVESSTWTHVKGLYSR
jgi:hypothetical protein